MTNLKKAIGCTIAAAAMIAPMIATSSAEARGRGSSGYYYYETFRTQRPERGYEGFAGIGKRSAYCSYRREPNRHCIITNSGREKCKIVSWKLIQHCY